MLQLHEAVQTLVDEYIMKLSALDNEFRAKVTALAWGITANTLSSAFAGGLPKELKKLSSGSALKIDVPRPKAIAGSKRERIETLLAAKTGKWIRRGGANVYTCAGPDETKDHFKMHKDGDSKQEIIVKFSTILSGWHHMP